MLVIIIGKNRAEYCNVRKKDISKHFYVTRDQCYRITPECYRQIEIYHGDAWVRTESVIVFDENNALPYYCKHPEYYEMDARLSAIDETKLMHPKKMGWTAWFTGGGKNSPLSQIITALPFILVGIIIVGALIFG